MGNEVNVIYKYKNSELGTAKLWLAWPEKRERNLQTNREPIPSRLCLMTTSPILN